MLKVGSLSFNLTSYEVKRGDTKIYLRKKELALLKLFMSEPGKVFNKIFLQEHIWSKQKKLKSNTIDAHIASLRRKIDRPFNKKLIKTYYGVGYSLKIS